MSDELVTLRAAAALNREADEALERATLERLPLERTVELLLPVLAQHTGASAIWLHTWDESLQLRDFRWAEGHANLADDEAALWEECRNGRAYLRRRDDHAIVGQHLDVAGEVFGAIGVRFEGTPDDASFERLRSLVDVWCEEIDNFLASIVRARRKHEVTRQISAALKAPVLDQGISAAIMALRQEVHFDDLLLVYRHEEDLVGPSLNYRVIKDGKLVHSSLDRSLQVDDATLERLRRLINGDDPGAPEHFGISGYREEVMIAGVRDEQVIGRLDVASPIGEFNTFDRDLLERFADHLRQRIVDFNREWRHLSLTFPRDVVVRLLSNADYREKYLVPRERDVAVLFCDISGFTRVSEQVLKEPALIGQLIDTWSARVVKIVWETGGVFDKMVGDCVIGLWGPPFFEASAKECCERAASAALQIREYTQEVHRELPALADMEQPLGVATGLNYAPLFVGLFGPNDDFTGFSSGMNNTARLQGVANRDEILCMDRFVETMDDEARFGESGEATVKNVAEPLRYRQLGR